MGTTPRIPDLLVGVVSLIVLVLGLATAWQVYRQAQTVDTMMGPMGPGAGQPSQALWIFLGTVLVVAVILVLYVAIRDQIVDQTGPGEPGTAAADPQPSEGGSFEGSDGSGPQVESSIKGPEDAIAILPDDERRILEPLLESPGMTQIELRDRADFSKSKISKTVSDLEKRGLVYREKQGRTYRVYPSIDNGDNAGDV